MPASIGRVWLEVDPHARRGLTLALDRIEQARIANNEIDWFVAAAEAILWLMVADELNWKKSGYKEHRDSGDPRGPALLGFRYPAPRRAGPPPAAVRGW